MKTIHLIRHAESNWESTNSTDFSRKLTENGRQEAHIIAEKLNKLNCSPNYFVCSATYRTKETAQIIAPYINYEFQKIIFDEEIYNSSLQQLLQILNDIPYINDDIVLMGHNPTLTELINYLTDDFMGSIPTCTAVKIELEIQEWKHITQGIGKIIYSIYPKMF